MVQVAEAAAAGKGVVATAAAQRVAQAKQAEVEELGLQLDEAEGLLAQAEAASRAQAAELAAAVERGEQLQARLQVTEALLAILLPSLAGRRAGAGQRTAARAGPVQCGKPHFSALFYMIQSEAELA